MPECSWEVTNASPQETGRKMGMLSLVDQHPNEDSRVLLLEERIIIHPEIGGYLFDIHIRKLGIALLKKCDTEFLMSGCC